MKTRHIFAMPDKKRADGLDWEDIRYFVALARHGTLSATARALRVNHATVARRVASLERLLGRALFDRRADGYRSPRTARRAGRGHRDGRGGARGAAPARCRHGIERPGAPDPPRVLADGFLIARLDGLHAALSGDRSRTDRAGPLVSVAGAKPTSRCGSAPRRTATLFPVASGASGSASMPRRPIATGSRRASALGVIGFEDETTRSSRPRGSRGVSRTPLSRSAATARSRRLRRRVPGSAWRCCRATSPTRGWCRCCRRTPARARRVAAHPPRPRKGAAHPRGERLSRRAVQEGTAAARGRLRALKISLNRLPLIVPPGGTVFRSMCVA